MGDAGRVVGIRWVCVWGSAVGQRRGAVPPECIHQQAGRVTRHAGALPGLFTALHAWKSFYQQQFR